MSNDWIEIPISRGQVNLLRALADDEQDATDTPRSRYADTWLVDSSAAGWAVVVSAYSPVELRGSLANLRALCEAIACLSKRHVHFAGRIKIELAKLGHSVDGWPGQVTRRKATPSSICDVAKAWAAGRKLSGGNYRTDGQIMYSWRLPIGVTEGGRKIALDYRGVSHSTTRHCGEAMRVADEVRRPDRR